MMKNSILDKSITWNPDINYSFQNKYFKFVASFTQKQFFRKQLFVVIITSVDIYGTRVQMVKNKQTKTLLLIYSKIGNKIKKNRKKAMQRIMVKWLSKKMLCVFQSLALFFLQCGKTANRQDVVQPQAKNVLSILIFRESYYR